jgi:hypothetical protein
MRLIRGVGGAVLWILASLLGLVAVLLCVTVILLPVGIPLLRLAGRSYGTATRLMLPRSVAHPVKETKRGFSRKSSEAKSAVPEVSVGDLWSRGRKKLKKQKHKGLFG